MYRVIWNASCQVWMAVSEIGKSKGKSKSQSNVLKIAPSCIKAVLISGGLMFTTIPALAAPITSNADGEWNTGGTWVGSTVPIASDDVVVEHNLDISSASATAANVDVINRKQIKITNNQTLTATTLDLGSTTDLGYLILQKGGTATIGGGTGTVNLDASTGSGSALYIGGANSSSSVAAGTLNAGIVNIKNSKSFIKFNHTNTSYNFTPKIEGSGDVNLSKGTTRLSGGFNNYTGTLTVDTNGILDIKASDKLDLGGAKFTQSSGGVLKIGVSSNSSYGKLVTTGTVTLPSKADIKIDVTGSRSTVTASKLDDIISAGTLTSDGTFNVTDNSTLFDFEAVKDGNTVDLTIKASDTTSVASKVSAAGLSAGAGAASVIDAAISSNASGNLASNFVSLSTDKEVVEAVESVLPALSGGMAQFTNLSSNAIGNMISERQDAVRGISSGDGFFTGGNMWIKPFSGTTKQNLSNGVKGYEMSNAGLAIGADKEISSEWTLGAAFSYGSGSVESNLDKGANTVDTSSYMVSTYATHAYDELTTINLQAGLGMSEYDSKRRLFNDDVASANYDGMNLKLSAQAERSKALSDKTLLSPYVHVDYSRVDVSSYNETGAGSLNLKVDSGASQSLILGLGVRADHAVSTQLSLLTNVGVGFDALAERSSLTASFEGGGSKFTTEGIEQSAFIYNASIGAQYALDNGMEITASYKLNGREGYSDQLLSAQFNMPF